MENLHGQEHKELERLFGELNLGRLDDRLKVADVFLKIEDHVSASQLLANLREQGLDFEGEFVAGTLELLVHLGFAHKKDFADREPLFEHRHLDDDHHDHFICLGCGKITEFYHPELERLQRTIARENGFKLLDHRHQLYGLCRECRATRQPGLPLTACKPGEKLTVVGQTGGQRARTRLTDMGLKPGSEVKILTDSGGPVVLACGGSRLALGRRLAEKLVCQPVENGDNGDNGQADD